jgi:hypothetical protein
MGDSLSISEIQKLIKMKRENPKKYEQTLKDIAEVSTDMVKMAMKVAKEMQKEIDKLEEDEQ